MPLFENRVENSSVGLYRRQVEKLAAICQATGHHKSAILRRALDVAFKHLDECSPPYACATPTGCAEHDAPTPIGLRSIQPVDEPSPSPEPPNAGGAFTLVLHKTYGVDMSMEEKHGDEYKTFTQATFDLVEGGILRGVGGILRPGSNWAFHVEGLEPKFGSEHSCRRWLNAYGYTIKWSWRDPNEPAPRGYDGA